MKKQAFLTFVLLLSSLFTAAAQEGGEFILRSGDPRLVAQKKQVVDIAFDYSQCQIQDFEKGLFYSTEEFLAKQTPGWKKDWLAELARAEKSLIEEFNDESDRAQVKQGSGADYKLVVRFDDFTYGRVIVRGDADLCNATGRIMVQDSTGTTVAVFGFTKVVGKTFGGAGAFEKRRVKCYENLGVKMATFLNAVKIKPGLLERAANKLAEKITGKSAE